MIRFGVITKIPKDLDGNYACCDLLINPDGDPDVVGANLLVDPPITDQEMFDYAVNERRNLTTIDLTKKQIVFCSIPVFRLGEILIMGDNDRTIPDGRKPSKWYVKCEYFDDIESAIKRAKEVVK